MIRKRYILKFLYNLLFCRFFALYSNFNTRNAFGIPAFKKNWKYSLCKGIILLFVIIFYTDFKADAAERINPFKPFFKDNLEHLEKQEDINSLLNYDISQLRLAAILQSKNKRFALLEGNTGRGYIVLEGNMIGSELYSVVDILRDKIIIKNIFGVELEMGLKKVERKIGR